MSGRGHGMRAMMRGVRRCVFLLLAVAVAGAVQLGAPSPVRAQPPNRVALVVYFGDRTVTRCVNFEERQITGYDVLERSGLEITASYGPMGAAICAIEGVGCSAERCLLCEAPKYWSYWRVVDGAWTYLQRGSSLVEVTDGEVQGWAWGEGNPPPIVAFDDVCEPLTVADAPPPVETPMPASTTESVATRVPPTATTGTLPMLTTATPISSAAVAGAELALPSPTPAVGVAGEPSWASYALLGGGLLAAALWFRHQSG
ncbi:MAG: hypothetical protein ACP5G7_05550 [Anaerolineae bacterium]